MSLKLNIGGGTGPVLDGYASVDAKTGDTAYPLTLSGKPVADGSCDEVRASHVLEHFGHRLTLHVLREWARALKPGGVLKVAVPDYDKCHAALENGNPENWPVEAYLFGGQTDENDFHAAMFNEQKLRTLLDLAGLSDVKPWASEVEDCASLPVSLNLCGVKSAASKLPMVGVSGILSMPRLDFTDVAELATTTALKLGCPIRKRVGPYWHSTLTMGIEECIREDDPKYILTMDSDTAYTPADVRQLYDLMEKHPEAAAICGMQVGRDRDTILLTVRKEGGEGNKGRLGRDELAGDLLPISTGHFGLCMLRVSDLRALPKPWFNAIPDPSGSWGEGRIDADIYFWRLLEREGKKAFQANRICLGHLQMVVTYPSVDFEPIHQYVGDWRRTGKPANVWK